MRHKGYPDLDRALMIFWESIKQDNSPEAERIKQGASIPNAPEREHIPISPMGAEASSGLAYEDLTIYEARKIPTGGSANPQDFFQRITQASSGMNLNEDIAPDIAGMGIEDEYDEYNSFEELVQSLRKKQATQPTPPQPQQNTQVSGQNQEMGWQPKYSVGTRVVNKNTRQEGVIVDISTTTQLYIVQYDDNPNPAFAREDEIALPEEVYKSLNEVTQQKPEQSQPKVTQQLNEVLFGKQQDTQQGQDGIDAKEVMKTVLTDPQVAPIVIERLLDAGVISSELALSLLAKVGAIPAPKEE